MDFYDLEIGGLKRRLPIRHISKKTRLANFSILGDVELVDTLADTLKTKLEGYEFDYLVANEIKIVPLVHGVAKRLGHKRFVVCRKSIKPYMNNPIVLKPQAHFPKHVNSVVIDLDDARLLSGKKVVIVDSVISTGVTLRMMKRLMQQIGAMVVLSIAVLKQGDAFDPLDNLFYLAEIPIFK